MQKIFTDKSIKSEKPKEKKYTLTESTGERGESRLQLNVYPSGVKKFQIQYFFEGKRKRLEIGKYGDQLGNYSLREARIKFSELAGLVKSGKNPKFEKRKTVDSGMRTVSQLFEDFMEWFKKNKKINSYNTISALLKKYMKGPVDLNMAANDFTADHGREIIYHAWNRGKKDTAMTLKSGLKSMFKFAIDYDNGPERFGKKDLYGVKSNPIRDISLSHVKNKGTRWLSEKEIYVIWHTETMNPMLQRYIKLQLALAGQRIAEIAHCNKREFDEEYNILTIPKDRVKIESRGDHAVPMGKMAITIYQDCLHFRSKDGLLFTAKGKENKVTSATMGNWLNTWLAKNTEIEKFTLRDIRRTCKTLMSKAGVNRDHRDMLQQHFRSDVATVHYDRYDYLKEKREAIEIWDKYLAIIVSC